LRETHCREWRAQLDTKTNGLESFSRFSLRKSAIHCRSVGALLAYRASRAECGLPRFGSRFGSTANRKALKPSAVPIVIRIIVASRCPLRLPFMVLIKVRLPLASDAHRSEALHSVCALRGFWTHVAELFAFRWLALSALGSLSSR